ncbi:unnamed protein product [Ilex paraguariensis]|uniref:Uncharacterized protein n=1 Tax=Ilex paraguariensis TaxID=185542 RepID=A0ABC8T0W4_9AQUA
MEKNVGWIKGTKTFKRTLDSYRGKESRAKWNEDGELYIGEHASSFRDGNQLRSFRRTFDLRSNVDNGERERYCSRWLCAFDSKTSLGVFATNDVNGLL